MIRRDIGKFGEDFTCEFLEEKRYRILKRNYRKPWGEIDIIAQTLRGTLVFVEVKAMRQGNLLPEDHLTGTKLCRVQRTAGLLANGEYSEESKRGWRIDLVAVVIGREGEIFRATHYENIGRG